ncbi:MAG: apolipoprotein N-acyltransferase [Leptolyngbya sp. SIO4C1]|nr:apolipoprotein N-acyltransferase [Leptolyngbya sp. SIO4C1]
MGLTPAPLNAWPLAWIALIPLWRLIQTPKSLRPAQGETKLRNSLLLTACWGLGYHGLALSWITALHPLMWLGIPWLGSVAIAAFAWAFITLWGIGIGVSWVLGMTVLTRWARLSPISQVLVGTALWCGIELLWSLGPLYWTSLSYTQSPDNLAILQLGKLSGHLTVTAAIVAVNGLLAMALSMPGQRKQWCIAALVGLLSCHLAGFVLYQRPLADRTDAAFTVGIIQGNIPTRQKLTAAGIQQAQSVYLEGYRQLSAQGVDAVLTPEGAIPNVWDLSRQRRYRFYRAVQQAEAVLWLGTFVRAPSRVQITQSLLALTPDEAMAGQYSKLKLVPLGEYMPLQSLLGDAIARLSPLETNMIPGQIDQQFQSGLGPAAVGICYESAYGWLFRHQVANGGEFIITASNNDPYPPRMMAQHHAQDVMRAVETDRWAVRGTNTGLSGLVDPHGRTRWLSVPNQRVQHISRLYRRRTQTPYVRWGDWLTPLLLGLSGGWIGYLRLTQRG